MDSKVKRFFDTLQNKKVAFIGVGVTHTRLIQMMAGKGIDCTLCDKRTAEQLGDVADELKACGVKFDLGERYLDGLMAYDVIFRTPGMYYNNEKLTAAREAGRVVTSEMEVFLDLCPCKKYAVTGSDGKTTTTTLIGEMLSAQGKTVHIGGNIGKPLLCYIEEIAPDDCAVVELSSFQLLSMRQAVDVAVVTNVAPNHLDVHGTMEEYIGAKKHLVVHQNAFSRTVLGADNEITRSFAELVRGDLRWFSRQGAVERGAFLDSEGYLCAAGENGVTRVVHRDEIRIPGVHNIENYLTAIAAVWGEVSPENIALVARVFGGVEHRIELVRELDGVKWYNDSIASSPTRAIAGLNSFSHKVILIAGGYDKKIPFEPLAPKIVEKVKHLILMGDTADKIQSVVLACEGYNPEALSIYHVDSMEQAVAKANELAVQGDIVTLSPACASFDQYANFELRGRHFKSIVNAL
ncbi:UDP-N-acetylmuramoyl-L-alanine--D-glutamate ligase [Hydrogenoanaerobacterium sp.]|uniref:UDP-N-acetylmuramoyl-L-alanine--D-glutamate ligase n=1 Tax=Hydrogenoanaerobacterium sp. TaxID=2953763 RepID=UPI002897D27C|nr:UDP-N-acetylmuramoyl-L-alanine--D-glutamate ligase [Hydrogenoanaerobacterium sp.]